MYILKNGDDVVTESDSPITYNNAECYWETPTGNYLDVDKVFTVTQFSHSVTTTEFKLLFTIQERVAIKEARASNPYIDDFYTLLDDPKTSEVNRSLQSVQEMLMYLVSENLLQEHRVHEILTQSPT